MERLFRPRDTNQLAKHIVDLATGQVEETHGPNPDAAKAGSKGGMVGGRSKALKMTPDERSEFGRRMAEARWAE